MPDQPQLPDRPGPAEWWRVAGLTALILLLINAFYLVAYAVPAPPVFGGFFFNLPDAYSYIAKMRAGWRGDWLFTLPYTLEPGAGVLVYTYYLFLGHLARWTGLNLWAMFHLARVVGGAVLLLSAYHFIARFVETPARRLGAWLVFALGSGLGWLYLIAQQFIPGLPQPLGLPTADLSVPEFIPSLSIFSTSHFCFTAALMLWILNWTLPGLAAAPVSVRTLALVALAVTLTAQTQPLALLVIGLVLGGLTLWQCVHQRRWHWPDWWPLVVVAGAAGPWLVYDVWVMTTHPVLQAWNAQNVTPSPALWEALVSGGLPLALTLPGLVVIARRRSPQDMVLVFWFGLHVLALYAPFSLQRRLALGLWMPIVLLAERGWSAVVAPRRAPPARTVSLALLALGVFLNNLVVGFSVYTLIATRAPGFFLAPEEVTALEWLDAQTPPGARVLAGPELGLYIPAYSAARVVYGHPMETVTAYLLRPAVEGFYSGLTPAQPFLAEHKIDYVVYGPREAKLGALPPLAGWRVVFQQGAVTIYGR